MASFLGCVPTPLLLALHRCVQRNLSLWAEVFWFLTCRWPSQVKHTLSVSFLSCRTICFNFKPICSSHQELQRNLWCCANKISICSDSIGLS